MSKINQLNEHLEKSRKNWAMAWQGSRQNDSPAGRFHDERVMEIFCSMSEVERAKLPADLQAELMEQEDIENLLFPE